MYKRHILGKIPLGTEEIPMLNLGTSVTAKSSGKYKKT